MTKEQIDAWLIEYVQPSGMPGDFTRNEVVEILYDFQSQPSSDQIAGMRKDMGMALEREKGLYDALQELVYLKSIKDIDSFKDEYERRKPIAWANAKLAISNYKQHQSQPSSGVEGLVKELENIRDNYDHDEDAHKYNNLPACVKCSATEALKKYNSQSPSTGEQGEIDEMGNDPL